MRLIKNTKLTAYDLNCGYIQKAIFDTEKGNIFAIEIAKQHAAYRFLLTLTENQLFYIVVGSFCLVGGSLLPTLIKGFCKLLVLTF